jgi:putative transcriptional regulator
MVRVGGVVRSDQADGAAGTRVRARRKDRGLTQQDLADAVGVSRQTIISMETGDYAPSVYLALKVASTLDITVEQLWG